MPPQGDQQIAFQQKLRPTNYSRSQLKSLVTRYQIVIVVLTFIAYVAVHANRKSFSNVKVLIVEEWSPFYKTPSRFQQTTNGTNMVALVRPKQPAETWSSRNLFPSRNDALCKAFLGVFNTVFMGVYATSQYFGGFLGDRFNLRLLLSTTLLGSSAMMIMCFCVSQWVGIYSIPWYLVFWILNAMFQGPAWPCVLSIMNNWFATSKNRGLILGIWSSNSSIGNVIGSFLVASFVDYGYELGILVPAILQISVAIIIFSGLVVSPQDVGLKLPEETEREEEESSEQSVPMKEGAVYNTRQAFEIVEVPGQPVKPVGFLKALCLPGVAIYALSYAALKLVNYAFFFWLPFYMNRRFHWSQADAGKLSIWYDVGGIAGACGIGFLSDRVSQSGTLLVHVVLALPTIVIYSFLPDDKIINAVVLFVIGYFIFGCVNTISSAVAADLGRHPALSSNKRAQATVSGIMEGTGSSCAALGQLAIPLIEQAFGWSSVFYMLIICGCLASLGVGRMVFSDLMRWRRCRVQKRTLKKTGTVTTTVD